MKVNAFVSNVADELPKNKIKKSRYETLMSDAANAEDFVYVDSEIMERQ